MSLLLKRLPLARRWRTKQNLDYCFLMMYAQSKGIYYVQVGQKLFSCPPEPCLTLPTLHMATLGGGTPLLPRVNPESRPLTVPPCAAGG